MDGSLIRSPVVTMELPECLVSSVSHRNIFSCQCVYGSRPVSAQRQVQLSVDSVSACWRSELDYN